MCFPLSCFFLLIPPPPTSTLFLYTTLFRSLRGSRPAAARPERLLPGRSREVRRCRERLGSGRHRRQRQHRPSGLRHPRPPEGGHPPVRRCGVPAYLDQAGGAVQAVLPPHLRDEIGRASAREGRAIEE